MNTATIKTNLLCFLSEGGSKARNGVLGMAQKAGVSAFFPSRKGMGFYASGGHNRYLAGVKMAQQHVEAGIVDVPRVPLQNCAKEAKVAEFGVVELQTNVRSHTPSVSMVGQGRMSVRLLTILFKGSMGVPQFLGEGEKGVLLPGGGNWTTKFGEGGRFRAAHLVAGFPAGSDTILIIPTIMDGKVVVHVLRREECNSTVLKEDEFHNRLSSSRERQLQFWSCSS